MKIQQIITILENKLKALEGERERAVIRGELDEVSRIDIDIVETRNTLSLLKPF